MVKKYSDDSLKKMNDRSYTKEVYGNKVLYKPIPETDEKGVVDPRLFKQMYSQYLFTKVLPKSMFKFDDSNESLIKLRKIFNGIKSIPISSNEVNVRHSLIETGDGGKIPYRIYYPNQLTPNCPALFYIHGGGFFAGSPDVVEEFVKMIVHKFKIIAFSIDYRLAPEHPYPTQHEDCFNLLKYLIEHAYEFGFDKNNLFVGGDSAGGNLAQYCTTRDIENKTKYIKGQILLYPTLNMGGVKDDQVDWSIDKYEISSKHRKIIENSLYMMANGAMDMLKKYLNVKDTKNIYLTPYLIENMKMPPTLLSVGEHDYLAVECLAYMAKLNRMNTDVRTIVYKGMGHAYADNIGVYPQSEDCAIEVGKFILDKSGYTL